MKVTLLNAPCIKDYRAAYAFMHGESAGVGEHLNYFDEMLEGGTDQGIYEFFREKFQNKMHPVMENFQFSFLIEDISRATTHQLVRTRIGANFSQESFRMTDIENRGFVIPATVSDCASREEFSVMKKTLEQCFEGLRKCYSWLRGQGIPYQDIRYIMPMGTRTSIIAVYSYTTLVNTYKRRSCKGQVQWEIYDVFQAIKNKFSMVCYDCVCNHSFCRDMMELLGGNLKRDCKAFRGTTCDCDGVMFEPCRIAETDKSSPLFVYDKNPNYWSK